MLEICAFSPQFGSLSQVRSTEALAADSWAQEVGSPRHGLIVDNKTRGCKYLSTSCRFPFDFSYPRTLSHRIEGWFSSLRRILFREPYLGPK